MRKVTPPENEKLPQTFGGRVMYLRKTAGQSQEYLAEILGGISRNYVNMIENNKRRPNIDILEALAKHFGVPSDFLLCRSDLPKGNADDIALEKRLGFSEKAITKLEALNLNNKSTWQTDILNLFITSERFEDLLNAVRNYSLENQTSVIGPQSIVDEADILLSKNVKRIDVHALQIQNILHEIASAIRDELDNDAMRKKWFHRAATSLYVTKLHETGAIGADWANAMQQTIDNGGGDLMMKMIIGDPGEYGRKLQELDERFATATGEPQFDYTMRLSRESYHIIQKALAHYHASEAEEKEADNAKQN